MYAYCLFCETVKCEDVAENIRRRYGYKAFSPKIVQRKWVKGMAYEETKTMLPGYIFTFTDAPVEFPRTVFRLDFVIRVLGDRDVNYTLMGDDYRFAMMLYQNDGTLGILKAYQEGDRVKLVEGALGGIQGEIIKLDRRKGRAQIRYRFAGTDCTTWVGYDLIDGNDKVDLKEAEEREQGTGNMEQE